MSECQSPALREEKRGRIFSMKVPVFNFFFLYVKDSFRIYRKSFCSPELQGVEETPMTDHTVIQRVLNHQVRYLLQGRTETGRVLLRQAVHRAKTNMPL